MVGADRFAHDHNDEFVVSVRCGEYGIGADGDMLLGR